MTLLTSKLLRTFPYSHYANALTIQRGKSYYKEGRVTDIELRGIQKAVCKVEGDSGDYTVEIELGKQSKKLYFDCDCPYAETHFCKHMVAAALELSDYLEEENALPGEDVDLEPQPTGLTPASRLSPAGLNGWQNKLDSFLYNFPVGSPSGSHIQRYAMVLLMVRMEYYDQNSYSFIPSIIKAKNWAVLRDYANQDGPAINTLLENNFEWYPLCEPLYSQVNQAGCLNLSAEAFTLLSFLQQYSGYTGGMNTFSTYFQMIENLQIPIFLASRSNKKLHSRIHILSNPAELRVIFTQEQGNLVLKSGIKDITVPAGTNSVDVLSYNPLWLLMGDKIFRLSQPNALSVLTGLPISIPEKHADQFREKYLKRVAEVLPIQSDLLVWQDIQCEPVPRLYLHDERSHILAADLRFAYEGFEFPAVKTGEMTSIITHPDSWELTRIHRQEQSEESFYQMLTNPTFCLKRAGGNQPYGSFELRAHSHPYDFLMHAIPQLTQAGFEIYGEESLKLGKINRSMPTLRVNITSGIDWFDLKTIVEFGDQQISLYNVHKALKHGENYIKLADGSVGQIPKEWLDKYKHLWNLANETTDGFRVSDFHMPLIDSLLESGAAVEAPSDLAQRRQRLQHFEEILSQPLPQGFRGELRPYQKHGVDWLHFLHDYHFGGILADDMGLGKTVQVLVFLLSLQENTPVKPVTLLVVPKSLIINWQRESEKFTPALRFLEYVGIGRKKDFSIFNDYDIVLTTYGTMLRDIDVLRNYKFDYIILDESQAIKNPLAKSAKAVRLLNAEHRIVMTGTPVENNTFELWSQFAFLNPGLLGNLDYFRREFVNPIENEHDELSAGTLRRLVYPFILRRTKEQVAPELPARTERIIYTDLDSAQKKLYTQTRERYQAELLGLIENQGMDNARMKILEGLLRLRQIAIHPKLVDKTYKGDAPKFEVLLETLETLQAENHKALIFSQFVETLKLVCQELDERNIKYLYLDGSTTDRQERVDLFQNDGDYPFFLISLKAGGVGLNLTAAEYVIHLDPWWNPAVEMQASDRAHRIGQNKPVFIYKIIARDTVEEKILLLQERKRALVKSLISTEGSFFKSLTKEDVKILFD